MGRYYKKWDIQWKQNIENMLKDMAFYRFQENLVINMVKKLVDTAIKTGIDTVKTASKRVVQKIEEATGDLIGNKIADKIISVSKTKRKEKEDERPEIYKPPEKRQQIIDDLRFFNTIIKTEYQKLQIY